MLELQVVRVEEGASVERKGGLCPFIKAENIERPPTSPKTRLFPRGRANGTVGLPKPVLMRIPQ